MWTGSSGLKLINYITSYSSMYSSCDKMEFLFCDNAETSVLESREVFGIGSACRLCFKCPATPGWRNLLNSIDLFTNAIVLRQTVLPLSSCCMGLTGTAVQAHPRLIASNIVFGPHFEITSFLDAADTLLQHLDKIRLSKRVLKKQAC